MRADPKGVRPFGGESISSGFWPRRRGSDPSSDRLSVGQAFDLPASKINLLDLQSIIHDDQIRPLANCQAARVV